jgi:hypothetical protein
MKSSPQALKRFSNPRRCGTTEVVPFPFYAEVVPFPFCIEVVNFPFCIEVVNFPSCAEVVPLPLCTVVVHFPVLFGTAEAQPALPTTWPPP